MGETDITPGAFLLVDLRGIAHQAVRFFLGLNDGNSILGALGNAQSAFEALFSIDFINSVLMTVIAFWGHWETHKAHLRHFLASIL